MRLLSYNIHKGIGGRDRRYRIERIIRVIEEESPDLVCLQEVDRNVRRSRHDDQPRRFAEAFQAATHLYQRRDLAITTDFRAALAAILGAHIGLGDSQLDLVFPGRPPVGVSLGQMLAA